MTEKIREPRPIQGITSLLLPSIEIVEVSKNKDKMLMLLN
jgi:hypothetical protein